MELLVQRELAKNIVVEVGYIATLGLKLEQNVQPNNAQPSTNTSIDSATALRRAGVCAGHFLPELSASVGQLRAGGFYQLPAAFAQSNYESGFVRFEKRFTQGLAILSSYTYSKAITNAPQFRNAGGVSAPRIRPAQDAFNLQAERGLASFHVANRFTTTAVYNLPFGRDGRLAEDRLDGEVGRRI